MNTEIQLNLSLSEDRIDEFFAVLGLKRGGKHSTELSRLRKFFHLHGWRFSVKWDHSYLETQSWGSLVESHLARGRIRKDNLEFLKRIVSFISYKEFPVDHQGFRQYHVVDGKKIEPTGNPFITSRSAITIVESILARPEKELPLFIGIHPYLDHAIELKMKGQLEEDY